MQTSNSKCRKLFSFDCHTRGVNVQRLCGLPVMPVPHFGMRQTMICVCWVSKIILEYSGTHRMSIEKLDGTLKPFCLATFQCQINTSHCVRFWCFQYLGLITDNSSAPEHIIRPSLEFYYHLGLNDKQIESNMKDHYDTSQFGLGCAIAFHQLNTNIDHDHYILSSISSIKRLRGKWGLKSTRQQQHTSESIANAIQTIRKSYPSRGAETIRKQLRMEFGIRAPR